MAVKITLTGDGLAFEADANLMQAAQIIGFLNNNTQEVLAPPSINNYTEPVALGITDRRLSPREHLQRTSAKTNSQKILVLGQFLTQRDNSESFSVSDLKSIFGKAGESTPRNLSRDLKDTVRAGYITTDESQSDHYIVTNTGLQQLESGFITTGSQTRRSVRPRSGGKPKDSTGKIGEQVGSLEITDVADGLPNFHSLKQKTDKLLWIMAFTQLKGVEPVSAKDIEHLARKLSDNIPAHQVAAYTKSALKRNYVSKTIEGYRLLHDGMQYLKAKLSSEKEG